MNRSLEMNSQILQAELSNLLQESKRKHSDLRNAAENSLNDLKSLPSTSESQLAADLVRRPNFVKPFVLACATRQARLAAIGVGCIQKLVAAGALPPERLKDVVDGLHGTTSLSLDVQLKVLQTLPSLFQHHADQLKGELLARTLEVCATLQSSKTAAVSNTAAATLQQLVVSVFEKVAKEDEAQDDIVGATTVVVRNEQISVSESAYDALRIFEDLCSLVEGEKAEFLGVKSFSRTFVLELIESVLASHHDVFSSHPELADLLRRRLMPLAVRYLSERHSFAATVRVARIVLLLFKFHLSLLTAECDMALSLLTHLLDTDTSSPWKRALCLEIFRSLYSEPGIVRQIYILFDEQEGRRNILRDHMACLARLASEKPTLIGISHQSTIPTAPDPSSDTIEDQVALEAVGVSGVIGNHSADTSISGISNQWSLLRHPYIETLDKVDNPSPPLTYIYSLVLNCISSFSEGIAKFILPLTASETKSKRKRRGSTSTKEGHQSTSDRQDNDINGASKMYSVPLNPMDLESHPQIVDIKATAGMIDACWPAVLATCSTFLYASLDAEFYHNLVRAFQKLAHVAGLLRLSTPRDALLTTLGKAAIPSDLINASTSRSASPAPESQQHLRAESPAGRSGGVSEFANATAENPGTSLSTRNLLCLRALLNLGIALGPTLDQSSWSIVLETLERADLIINVPTLSASRPISQNQAAEKGADTSAESLKTGVGTEIMAVHSAAAKMFESTAEYPNSSFEVILRALLGLSETAESSVTDVAERSPNSPDRRQNSLQINRAHQSKRSVSLGRGRSRTQDNELKFVLGKINDLARANIKRLAALGRNDRIWDTLVNSLIEITGNEQISSPLRIKAADVLDKAVFSTIKLGGQADPASQNQIQLRGLLALKSQVSVLYKGERASSAAVRSADFEIHDLGLETLKAILEECGESVTTGWELVFDLISSAFDRSVGSVVDESKSGEQHHFSKTSSIPTVRSPKLIRAAYDSLQLVASDFLSLLPASCLLEMVESFSNFGAQKEDFNISLTTTTHFWNISDFLSSQMGGWSIGSHIDVSSSDGTLTGMAKDPDFNVSKNALWLLLLLRIVNLSIDTRAEIRNGAVRTILRIMDQDGDQLSPDAWHLCLNRVLFVMAETIQQTTLETMKSGKQSSDTDRKSWVDTTGVVTKGLSNLIANYYTSIIQYKEFGRSWSRLLRYFEVLISLEVLELREIIFFSFSEVLSRIQTYEDIGLDLLEAAWHLWVSQRPVGHLEAAETKMENQQALLAYMRSFEQLYRLLKEKLTESDVTQVLEKFRISIWQSITSRYSPDLERESELQGLVVESLRSLCVDKTTSQPAITTCLAEFSDSPFTKWSPKYERDRPTYVAFSKSIMKLLSWYISEHDIKTDILSDGTICHVLEHLANPMLNKYAWSGRDCKPTLWQAATTTSLDVLQVAIPHVEKQYGNTEQRTVAHFWRCIVNVTRGIVTVIHKDSKLQGADISSDETFDIEAFQRLRFMVIPSLGSSYVPDRVRCEFASTLFYSSLIYLPQRLDLPEATIEKEPLRNLYKIRMGRTYDPPPTPRSNLCYVLMDTLFDLASSKQAVTPSHASSGGGSASGAPSSYITIAKSISPYLILRCAVSLKAYIADQPLRGLMPQPILARAELLYLLRQLVGLRSEPVAIPPAGPNVPLAGQTRSRSDTHSEDGDDEEDDASMYKKHLGWIYPLAVKALGVAGKETDDKSVLDALTDVLERAGGDGSDTDDE